MRSIEPLEIDVDMRTKKSEDGRKVAARVASLTRDLWRGST